MSMAGGAHALLIGLACAAVATCGTREAPVIEPANQADRTDKPLANRGPRLDQPSRLTGRLDARDGRQLLSAAVILISRDDDDAVALPGQDVRVRPDGTFEFRTVPPGRYEIRARGETDKNGPSLFATFRVIVEERDLKNLNLTLLPGASLSGMVIVERVHMARPPALDGIRVRAPMADGTSFGDAVPEEMRPGGEFAIRGLMPGSHVVRLDGLPDPWVLKSVVHRGRDITDAGVDAEPQQHFTEVRVTITDATTDVSGTVRDAEGNPGAAAIVVVAPLLPRFWSRTSRRLGVTRADALGRYRLRGLPSGEYRMLASAGLDENAAFDRTVLRGVAATGVPLTLGDLETHVLDLRLTRMDHGTPPEPEPHS